MTKPESATTAQLQSIMACMKKSGDQREDGAAPVTEAEVERWLSQLSEASGTFLITRNTLIQQTCCISVLSFLLPADTVTQCDMLANLHIHMQSCCCCSIAVGAGVMEAFVRECEVQTLYTYQAPLSSR